jgi:Tol biopolymer transport system component
MIAGPRRRALAAGALAFALAASTALPGHAARRSAVGIAVTQQFNVFLMHGDGSGRQVVTTRGTGYQGIYYPWYQWSPDGKYLLLVRANAALRTSDNQDLLLLNADGTVIRTLATGIPQADFYPSWAIDGDRIVYVALQRASGGALRNTVATVDTGGQHGAGWSYDSHEGCGGGTPDPAQQLLNQEVGFGAVRQSMQWSIGRHIAVYSASCVGGLNVTNTETGKTERLDPHGQSWTEAALSPQGKLALMTVPPGSGTRSVVLTTPVAGAHWTIIAHGELPVWSRDGRTLYFEQRLVLKQLQLSDEQGSPFLGLQERTAIWRANADGSSATLLIGQDAFGFGPLNLTADGKAMIFSSVDNETGLLQHLPAKGQLTPALLQQFGPRVRIQRYDVGASITTLLVGAGMPAVQP